MLKVVDLVHGPSFFSHCLFHFSKVLAAPLINHDMLILSCPVMGGGGGTVSHWAVLSSFAATMGKVSRAADGGAPLGRPTAH